MNILKTIINNESGYERKQDRLKKIEENLDNIMFSDECYDIDNVVEELICNKINIDFKLKDDKEKSLVKQL